MDILPVEILRDILLKLDYHQILICELVCKLWYIVINTKNFYIDKFFNIPLLELEAKISTEKIYIPLSFWVNKDPKLSFPSQLNPAGMNAGNQCELIADPSKQYEIAWKKYGLRKDTISNKYYINYYYHIYKILPEIKFYYLNNVCIGMKYGALGLNNLYGKKCCNLANNYFRHLMETLRSNIPEEYFISWVDHLIELYNFPCELHSNLIIGQLIIRHDSVPSTEQWNKCISWYERLISDSDWKTLTQVEKNEKMKWTWCWNIITVQITKINSKYTRKFIEKHFIELDWKITDLYKHIDEYFIYTHKMLWSVFTWEFIFKHVSLTESFIENVIIQNIHKKLNIKINFTPMFQSQRLSIKFLNKWLVNNVDNTFNNETNWDIVLHSISIRCLSFRTAHTGMSRYGGQEDKHLALSELDTCSEEVMKEEEFYNKYKNKKSTPIISSSYLHQLCNNGGVLFKRNLQFLKN